MRKLIIIIAVGCLLTACDKNENEDYIAQYFFGGSEVQDKPDEPDSGNDNDTPGQVPTKGLVAYYPFDGDTGDESGNHLSAKISGDIRVTTGHNNNSRCAYFPGSKNSYLYVPFNNKLQMNEWTINLWFCYESTKNRDGALLQMGRDNVLGSFYIGMNVVYFVNSKGDTQYGTLYNSMEEYPSPSAWHMITINVKNIDVALYFDGKLVWRDTLSSKYVNEVTQDMYIGASKWYGSMASPFEGFIDDVRIYNRILSDEEVQVLYKN